MQGAWREDGPLIRVDFLRRSSRNRVTMVLHDSGPQVTSLWNVIPAASWQVAKQHLVTREGVEKWPQMVSHWTVGEPEPKHILGLPQWAAAKEVEHVLWTSLPPRWNHVDGNVPTAGEVVGFLQGLPDGSQMNAEEYVRKTPGQIVTPIRTAIEAQLGWFRLPD